MATTAVDSIFVDTNVLAYSTLQFSQFHIVAIQKLGALRQNAGVEMWISRQVLREYLATLTRPQATTPQTPVADIIADIHAFQAKFRIAEDSPAITDNLLALVSTIPLGGKQVHDANIVATMQAYNIPKLLTHNTADFARYASLIIVVPLVP